MTNDKFTLFYTGPFSQWHRSKFHYEGWTYNSAEQCMMHQKALLFGDSATAAKIMKAKHPRDQKALGREVANFDEKTWNEVARDIVYKGNYCKFGTNLPLLKTLRKTQGILVECSPADTVWGVGLGIDDPRCLDQTQWLGKNWLGEVLTKVREDLASNIYRVRDFGWSQT